MTEFNTLTTFLASIAAPPRYELFSQGERHGSYERTWYRSEANGMVRFVVLAVTQESQLSRCQVEIWAGANYEERSGRQLVAQFKVVYLEELFGEPMKDSITAAVSKAEDYADKLQSADLLFVGARQPLAVEKIPAVGKPPQPVGDQ